MKEIKKILVYIFKRLILYFTKYNKNKMEKTINRKENLKIF